MTVWVALAIGEWVALGAWWAVLAVEGHRDRRMMRRLNAQPWWPPLGTEPPTVAELHRRRVG